MSPLSIATWALASASSTLALIHAGIWWRDRTARGHLAFAVLAIGVAFFGLSELAMMKAGTVQQFAASLRWAHLPIFMMVVGIVSFVRAEFGTGRAVLGHAAWAINGLTLVVDVWRAPNADYETLTGLDQVRYLGEMVSVGVGQTSAWHWVGQVSFLFTLAFVADASITLWKRGDSEARRRAVTVGGTILAFVSLAAGQAALVYARIVHVPHFGAPLFLPVLVVMGLALSKEVLRAAGLTHALQGSEAALRVSEERMRQAAQEAQLLSSRLIGAQEEERRRIARELHDDLSQRLAVVALDLNALQHAPVDDHSEARLGRVMSEVRALSSDLHGLSYRLHPAKLDQLGLVNTARGWCRDHVAKSGLAVDFLSDGLPDDLQGQEAVCLFRILQEATRNVVRHSGAKSVHVALFAAADGVHLVVEDFGSGFDANAENRTRGLGLMSMEERARSLGGRLVIESHPGRGTRVEAIVPVGPATGAAPAGRKENV